MKTKVIFRIHHFLMILLHLSISIALEVIYVDSVWNRGLCASLPTLRSGKSHW